MTCNFDKDELILKVLDGVATPEEILMLSRWMEEDPANEIYFNQLKKAWNLMKFDIVVSPGMISCILSQSIRLRNL